MAVWLHRYYQSPILEIGVLASVQRQLELPGDDN
jgi:hypothetical protein